MTKTKPTGVNLHPHEINAALAGRLRMLVRVCKTQPDDPDAVPYWIAASTERHLRGRFGFHVKTPEHEYSYRKIGEPFKSLYKPGKELFGRETWGRVDDCYGSPLVVYQHDGSAVYEGVNQTCGEAAEATFFLPEIGDWNLTRSMPEWASRFRFRVTSCDLRRVQTITEQEARECGAVEMCVLPGDRGSFVQPFACEWDQHNPRYPWSINPWAWFVGIEGRD